MTNVAHNGFACPLCRSDMVEMPEEEEDEDAPARYEDSSDDGYDSDEEASRAEDYDGESDYGDDLEDIINYHKSAIQEETENHMLRGMRWMFQRVEEDDDAESIWETDSETEEESDAESEAESDAESDAVEEVESVASSNEVEDAVIPVNYQINFSSQRRSRWMEQRDHWRTD